MGITHSGVQHRDDNISGRSMGVPTARGIYLVQPPERTVQVLWIIWNGGGSSHQVVRFRKIHQAAGCEPGHKLPHRVALGYRNDLQPSWRVEGLQDFGVVFTMESGQSLGVDGSLRLHQ